MVDVAQLKRSGRDRAGPLLAQGQLNAPRSVAQRQGRAPGNPRQPAPVFNLVARRQRDKSAARTP